MRNYIFAALVASASIISFSNGARADIFSDVTDQVSAAVSQAASTVTQVQVPDPNIQVNPQVTIFGGSNQQVDNGQNQ